jgi:hypothetical protein
MIRGKIYNKLRYTIDSINSITDAINNKADSNITKNRTIQAYGDLINSLVVTEDTKFKDISVTNVFNMINCFEQDGVITVDESMSVTTVEFVPDKNSITSIDMTEGIKFANVEYKIVPKDVTILELPNNQEFADIEQTIVSTKINYINTDSIPSVTKAEFYTMKQNTNVVNVNNDISVTTFTKISNI